jgi:D-3-phosphoglycerate dehydrogenase
MKILINDGISPEGEKILVDAGFDVHNVNIPQNELLTKIQEYDAIIVRSATQVRKDLIDVSNLKVIARSGVGLDNIDVEYAKSKGIKVVNTPGASSISVAELAIGHLFAINRFLNVSTTIMKNGKWPKKEFAGGREATGKTMGIIGLGAIGRETAIRAKGLMMNVIAFDPYVKENNLGIEMVSKEELLSKSDVISLHIPFNKEQGAFISEKEFAQMKDGVILINCARGGVVDEKALLDALNSGKVSGAGIDVFVNEPVTEAQSELIAHQNVSITPHIGASTDEAQLRVSTEIAENVINALNS